MCVHAFVSPNVLCRLASASVRRGCMQISTWRSNVANNEQPKSDTKNRIQRHSAFAVETENNFRVCCLLGVCADARGVAVCVCVCACLLSFMGTILCKSQHISLAVNAGVFAIKIETVITIVVFK